MRNYRFTLPALAMVLALLALALAPATAMAQEGDPDEKKNMRPFAGWDFQKAPNSTHVTIYTTAVGTKDEFEENDLDQWAGTLFASAEFGIGPISVFGQVGYQGLGGGDAPTGFTDPLAGVKFNLINDSSFLISIWGAGNIPVGDDDVAANFEATNVGVSLTVAVADIFGVNAGADFGRIWKQINDDGGTTKGIEFSFFGEFVISVPFLTARGGLQGIFRDNGLDNEQFQLYVEALIIDFVFVRVAFPFDVEEEIGGIKEGFESGQLVVYAGIEIFGF